MKLFRILFISCLTFSIPFSLLAENGLVDSNEALTKMNLLVLQLEARIKQLQAENAVLKNEIAKAGIKIPLSDFSGATVIAIPTSLPAQAASSPIPGNSGSSIPVTPDTLTAQYGKDV
jgi:hypothetical protein